MSCELDKVVAYITKYYETNYGDKKPQTMQGIATLLETLKLAQEIKNDGASFTKYVQGKKAYSKGAVVTKTNNNNKYLLIFSLV